MSKEVVLQQALGFFPFIFYKTRIQNLWNIQPGLFSTAEKLLWHEKLDVVTKPRSKGHPQSPGAGKTRSALSSQHQQLNGENPSLTGTVQTSSMITSSCDISCRRADLCIRLLTLKSCWCVFTASDVKDWFIYFIVRRTCGHGRTCFHLIFKTWKSDDILVCRMQPAAFRFNCSAYLTTPVGAAPLHTAEVALIIQISGDAYLVLCFLIHSWNKTYIASRSDFSVSVSHPCHAIALMTLLPPQCKSLNH